MWALIAYTAVRGGASLQGVIPQEMDKRPPTDRTSRCGVVLQRVGCIRKAKVGLKRKADISRKGWGQFAKDIYVRSKVDIKRKRTAEAALMLSKVTNP